MLSDKEWVWDSLMQTAMYRQPARVQIPSSLPSVALSATSSGRTRGSELHLLAPPKMARQTHANQAFVVYSFSCHCRSNVGRCRSLNGEACHSGERVTTGNEVEHMEAQGEDEPTENVLLLRLK